MMRPAGTVLLVLLFAGVGALSWRLELRPSLQVDATPLASLPRRLGEWEAVDVPLEPDVESILRADANLQRIYVDPKGTRISLYVGYYGTDRGGRPEHTPAVCYRSQGFEVDDRGVLEVSASLRVHEYRVEQGTTRHLVHFWFRSYRRSGLVGELDQTFDRLVGRLVSGRADGSLIRISVPLHGGEDEAVVRERLLAFAAAVDAQLSAHWPTESPVSTTSAK